MVAKLGIIKVASGEQRMQTAVTLIASETLIVAQRTPNLTAAIVHTECRAGTYAHCAIYPDAVFHHHIEHTTGKHATVSSAFKHKATFFPNFHISAIFKQGKDFKKGKEPCSIPFTIHDLKS